MDPSARAGLLPLPRDGVVTACPLQVMRTVKFLTAMSCVPHFVSTEWIDASKKAKRWLPEANFPIPES
jgi:hypothetical protein